MPVMMPMGHNMMMQQYHGAGLADPVQPGESIISPGMVAALTAGALVSGAISGLIVGGIVGLIAGCRVED